MRSTTARWLVVCSLGIGAFAVACATRDPGTDTGDEPDAGTPPVTTPDGGTTTPDAGTVGGDYTLTTIADAITQASSLHAVEIRDAVVVGERHFGDPVTGTFYIQNGAGPGLAVFKGKNDVVDAFPVVGDIVTVKGHFSRFNGMLEVSGSTKYAQPLSVVITGHNATSPGGAYPPAGMPILAGETAAYAKDAADKHDAQVGNALQFNSPLTITNTRAMVATAQDGGTTPAGFEVTGGMLVDDTYVYFDCIKGLDGGVGALDLSHGIRGVWDRYQDFGAGTSQNPAPVQPALFPMNCDDLHPAQAQ
jgi:hypothetical protein